VKTRKYTKEQIIEALERNGGFLTQTAKALQCTIQTVQNYIKRDKKIGNAYHQIRETYIDLAESQLIKAVKNGEAWSIAFLLKCQGKHRGWVEKQEFEHTGVGGGPIIIKVLYDEKEVNGD